MPRNRVEPDAALALEGLFESGLRGSLTDEELLARFLERGDAHALRALVERYGPLVLSVCREILADSNDVDDAYQATFLVFLRKARTIRRPGSLAAWLHGVAYRVAMRTKGRPRAVPLTVEPASKHPTCPLVEREQYEILHREVERLPEKYRLPIVLCYFQGLTQDDAARRLRWPIGTVRGRLARGRDRLGDRLSRKGVDLSVGLARFVEATCKNRTEFCPDHAASVLRLLDRVVPSAVANLSHGVLVAMFIESLKRVVLTMAASALLLTAGSGMLALAGPRQDPKEKKQPAPAGTVKDTQAEAPAAKGPGPRVDLKEEMIETLESKKVDAEILEMEVEALKSSISRAVSTIEQLRFTPGPSDSAKYVDINRRHLDEMRLEYRDKRLQLARLKSQINRDSGQQSDKPTQSNTDLADLSRRIQAMESKLDRVVELLENKGR